MGKLENLYIEEYVNHYIKLGVDKIFIYDDNDINTEKFSDVLKKGKYRKYVTIFFTTFYRFKYIYLITLNT